LARVSNESSPPDQVPTAMQWINSHYHASGGMSLQHAGSLRYEVGLHDGAYYIAGLQQFLKNGPSTVHTICIVGHASSFNLPHTNQSVQMVGEERFAVSGHPGARLHPGLLTVANHADVLHFAQFDSVKPGTTDAAI